MGKGAIKREVAGGEERGGEREEGREGGAE